MHYILQLQYNWVILKSKIVQKSKYKTQAIPLKYWYRIFPVGPGKYK